MKIDNKFSPFRIKKSAGAYSSFTTLVESIARQLEFKLSCVERVTIKESKSTDSVYLEVTFKEHSEIYNFSIRNHPKHETYKGAGFLIQKHKDSGHLYKSVRNSVIHYNETILSEKEASYEVSPFGELLLNALNEQSKWLYYKKDWNFSPFCLHTFKI